MYTLDEFRAQADSGRRRMIRYSLIMCAAFWPLVILLIFASAWVERLHNGYGWIGFPIIFLFGCGYVYLFVCISNKVFPRCHNCGHSLNFISERLVIASGNCPFCGKLVIDKDA